VPNPPGDRNARQEHAHDTGLPRIDLSTRAHGRRTALLVDAENIIGPSRPRLSTVRARLNALLNTTGPAHHTVVAFGPGWPIDDTVFSALIELGTVPWPVSAEPDAAETALAEHARYLATHGQWRFIVASGDHRLARVAEYGELRVLAWETHAVSTRLESAAIAVHRLPKPTGNTPVEETTSVPPDPGRPDPRQPVGERPGLAHQLLTALATGVGIAIGHHVTDAIARWLRRNGQSKPS